MIKEDFEKLPYGTMVFSKNEPKIYTLATRLELEEAIPIGKSKVILVELSGETDDNGEIEEHHIDSSHPMVESIENLEHAFGLARMAGKLDPYTYAIMALQRTNAYTIQNIVLDLKAKVEGAMGQNGRRL